MGDRHGGRFARQGRALSPLRRGFPMARGGGQNLPRAETLPSAKASRHGARAKGFARAGTRPSAKASRHGARAKGFAPRRNTPHGEGLPTRRTGERICPAGFAFAPRADERRAALDRRTAGKTHLRRGRTRDRARAKGFAPRRNAPHGEGLPTRRTSERICPAGERSPRRRPPDTAHEQKDLPRAGTRPTAKVSRHGARAKGFAPRRNAPLGEGLPTRRTSEKICPAGVRPRPTCRRTAGRPRPTDSRKTPLRRGRTHSACGRCRVHSPKKIRLLHEIQLFYGESHVGSRQIFPSFPSVGRCVARERNPVPPVAPHCGRGHRGLRRTCERMRRFDAMCPCGGELLPHGGNGWLRGGGRRGPGLRSFGERFHRRRCANPDACRAPRCSHGHDDLGRRAFRCSRPTFRNRRRSDEKNFRAPRCSRD